MTLANMIRGFVGSVFLSILMSSSLFGAVAVATPANEDCIEQFFMGQASTSCLEQQGTDLLLEIRLNFRNGRYNAHGGELIAKKVAADGTVKIVFRSPIVTSRLGEMDEVFVSNLLPLTTDDYGLTGYPLLDLSGTEGFEEGDWVFIHYYLGNESSIAGSYACVRVRDFAQLQQIIDALQANGGTVSAVVIHAR